MKKSVKFVLGTAGAVAGLAAVSGNLLYKYTVTGSGVSKLLPTIYKIDQKNIEKKNAKAGIQPPPKDEALIKRSDEWFDAAERLEVRTCNPIGEECFAQLVKNPSGSHNWVIAVHGYTSTPKGMAKYACWYYDEGFSVIFPHMRGHFGSGTDKITMGWYDRYDVIGWIYYILDIDPEAKIVLHGESMGAATVMMTVGEALPENVVCAVEDCGYTSVWDEFSTQIKASLKLPVFPFLYAADAVARIRSDFSFKEASAVKQLRNSKTPMLFIHGEADDFVPFEMVYENFNAFDGEKDILTIPGAAHAEAILIDPETYVAKVKEFVGRYICDD